MIERATDPRASGAIQSAQSLSRMLRYCRDPEPSIAPYEIQIRSQAHIVSQYKIETFSFRAIP